MTFYYFVNVTKNIKDFAGKTSIKNVGIMSLFESVIYANNWDSKDQVMAFPENEQYDHPIMIYHNGDFEFKCNDECEIDGTPNNGEIEQKKVCDDCSDSDCSAFYEEFSERKLGFRYDYAMSDMSDDMSHIDIGDCVKCNVAFSVWCETFTCFECGNDWCYDCANDDVYCKPCAIKLEKN